MSRYLFGSASSILSLRPLALDVFGEQLVDGFRVSLGTCLQRSSERFESTVGFGTDFLDLGPRFTDFVLAARSQRVERARIIKGGHDFGHARRFCLCRRSHLDGPATQINQPPDHSFYCRAGLHNAHERMTCSNTAKFGAVGVPSRECPCVGLESLLVWQRSHYIAAEPPQDFSLNLGARSCASETPVLQLVLKSPLPSNGALAALPRTTRDIPNNSGNQGRDRRDQEFLPEGHQQNVSGTRVEGMGVRCGWSDVGAVVRSLEVKVLCVDHLARFSAVLSCYRSHLQQLCRGLGCGLLVSESRL